MKKIICFGDSITDMGRWRNTDSTGFSFGVGYPLMLKERYERENIKVELINRGCGGDSTTDLLARLDTDVIQNKPDIVTILIGTNDVWHQFDKPDETHHGNKLENYLLNYRKILNTIKEKLPNAKILIFAPFFLALPQPERKDFWKFMENLYVYSDELEKLAKEYNIKFTKLQPLIDKAKEQYGTENVLYDGIHPNVRGSIILADEFYKQLKEFIG